MKITCPYQLHRLRCALTIAVIAGCTLTACEKQEQAQPTRDITITFDRYGHGIEPEVMKAYGNDPDIRYVYMIPATDKKHEWDWCARHNIHALCNYLDNAIKLSHNKARGRGSFDFTPGAAAPVDSLWLAEHGWAIKQR